MLGVARFGDTSPIVPLTKLLPEAMSINRVDFNAAALVELNQKLCMPTDPLHSRIDTERCCRRYRRKARGRRSR